MYWVEDIVYVSYFYYICIKYIKFCLFLLDIRNKIYGYCLYFMFKDCCGII